MTTPTKPRPPATLYVRMTRADRKRVAEVAQKLGFRSDSAWVLAMLKKCIADLDSSASQG